RNGKSKKTVVSEYGEQEIEVPRDRQGEFNPIVVKKHQSNVTGKYSLLFTASFLQQSSYITIF
ncbi:MAG: family transposase, partial [Bacilli bacterium]|nr:family transposase [Bacilli bacterium]